MIFKIIYLNIKNYIIKNIFYYNLINKFDFKLLIKKF